MDISGLASVTTAAEMLTWLTENCITPISPAMSGSDFGAIMQKIVDVTSGTADISTFLKSLPGYVGDGSQMLGDDLQWHPAPPVATLVAPVLSLGAITNAGITSTWNTPANATSFTLERALDANFTTGIADAYNGPNDFCNDTGLDSGTSYWYRVKCMAHGYIDSPYSNVVEGTTRGAVSFLLTGAKFPLVVDANNRAQLIFTFSAPTTVTVDWNDGNVNTYNTGSGNNLMWYDLGANVSGTQPSYALPAHLYSDGSTTTQRNVTFSFDKNLLTSIFIGLIKLDIQNFTFAFGKYPALNTFRVSQIGLNQLGAFTGLDLDNIPSSTQLTQLAINSAFASGSAPYATIPLGIFSFPLNYLAIGSAGMGVSSFSGCNLDKIGTYLAGTLQSLTIQNTPLHDDNNGQGALPSNFNLLTKLTTLSLLTTSHTTTPAIINSMTSLTTLVIGYGYLTSYGDFSALTNLTSISFSANNTFVTTSLPAYFANFTKLKNVYYQDFAGVLDDLITSWYNLIVANAPMTGISTSPFRSMSFNVNIVATGDHTQIPSGTLQQPSGYVQGSANGTPASSLERIWVLIHQYGHTWSYRTS